MFNASVLTFQEFAMREQLPLATIAEALPLAERIEDVLVMAPTPLLAQKVIAYHQRQGKPKAGTDWRDIAMLLLAFPNLKASPELVEAELIKADADLSTIAIWQTLVQQDIQPADEDEDF
jgi:hypothetical protein